MYSRFKDKIWAAYSDEMGSLLLNCSVKYVLYVINVFTKHAYVKPSDTKAKTALDGFIDIVNESNHKPNKLQAEVYKNFEG